MSRRPLHFLLSVLFVLTLFVPIFNNPITRAAQADGEVVMDPALTEALLNAVAPVEVVVTFDGTDPLDDTDVALLENLGITQGLTFESLPIAGVLATAAQVDALAQEPSVRSLYLNAPLTLYNGEANELTGVDRVRTNSTMTQRNGGLPVAGSGVTVVVNDSGIDCLHPDLANNCLENVLGTTNLNAYSGLLPVTYVEGVPNTDTNSGHGTHVAGSVAATGAQSSGLYEGAAPAAGLVGYGSGAALFVLDGIGGFDYAITHQFQHNIRVITNSWGSSGDFEPNDPINVASKRAYDRGITVLFAAGNEGPSENTHNPYAKAPWVISVAAGTKQGTLADFSSRGTAGVGGTFTIDGETWTWEDRPTLTAPGVDIISTRAFAPVSTLGTDKDIELIPPAYIPWYTTMSGTSMATPHTAGIVALLLDANPVLSPAEIKDILQDTATNMPGYETWEVGAGYVNAFAAVDRAFQVRDYGTTLNMNHTFNSNATSSATRQPFTVEYDPIFYTSNNMPFTVPAGTTELIARIDGYGLIGEGNPVNLVLIAPDGTEYSSGISLLFTLYYDRVVSVTAPTAGAWTLEVRGLRGTEENPLGGVGLPENVAGTLTFKSISSFTGLSDIAGNAAESAIKVAVSERLVDGSSNGRYRPTQALKRAELAQYLVRGAAIRQFLPLDGSSTFSDVSATDRPFVEAVAAQGAALKDRVQQANGVMRPTASGTFAPTASVNRANLAYSLVQSLGLQADALALNSGDVTVQYGDSRIAIDDAAQIPADLRGYVQLALDLNILNAYFTLQQGPYDLVPTIHATFRPTQTVTRGDYAVTIARFFNAYLASE